MPLSAGKAGPTATSAYRLIAWLTRWQLHTRMKRPGNSRAPRLVFALSMGALSLGTITALAVISDLPLLFPPLAPSAFILFTTPLAPRAAPRSVVLGHTSAMVAGIGVLAIVDALWPGVDMKDPTLMNLPRIIAIAGTTALATTFLLVLRCDHPPAAASALLAAMGWFSEPLQVVALIAAAGLLCLEAMLLTRIVGGLPYPRWSPAEELVKLYGPLAGGPEEACSHWLRIQDRILAEQDALPGERHERIV